MRTKQVECIVYKKENHEYLFLLLLRIPSKGHFWQPPCGGVEESDLSLRDAVYREIKEEAGITKNDVLNIIENVHSFQMNNDYLSDEKILPITEYVFGIEVNKEIKISIDNNIYVEHEEFRWVVFEEAMTLLKWDDNKEALKKLWKLLN